MSNKIQVIKDRSGNNILPITHEKAVRDSNGVSLETKLGSLESKTYVEAWDGESTPVVANIPAGVTVTYNSTTYTGTLAASASTDGKVYLVKNGTEYDRYFSSQNLAGNYVWSNLGTTGMDLSDYATKEEVSQLEAKMFELGVSLVPLLKKIVFKDNDAENLIDTIDSLLNNDELVSISAVYTQTGTIYEGQPLTDLKDGLVVTASYVSGRTAEVTTYELSGTLAAGTSVITVTFNEKTTTFNVLVTDAVYYRATGVGDGVRIAYRVAPRAAFTSSNRANAATINGVIYYFTQGGTKVEGAKKRSLYYLFDLLLTAGRTYRFEFEVSGLVTGQQIFVGLPYFSETFRAAGVTNSSAAQDYNDQVTDTGWLTPTENNGTLVVTYETPANCVGTRINLKVQSNGTDIEWPSYLRFTRFAIRDVTE